MGAITTEASSVLISQVSFWEIAIKHALTRSDMPLSAAQSIPSADARAVAPPSLVWVHQSGGERVCKSRNAWLSGDWDVRSDVDLLAVPPDQSAADRLAESLLAAGLEHDVIGLTQGRWLERQRGEDPW